MKRGNLPGGPLFQEDYKPQLSGHETFPLRYGWLKKVYDRVKATREEKGDEDNKAAVWGEDAIAHFGVGKNMVGAMRHWSKVAGIIEEAGGIWITELGESIFRDRGLDPYMEHHSTLWLLHWQIAAYPRLTTWFWAFNHFPAIVFEREQLSRQLQLLADSRQWQRTSNATIKNDVQCFLRTYVPKRLARKSGHDDAIESPFTELGLIKHAGASGSFRFVRGAKHTLGDGIFTYALLKFWSQFHASANTLSFEAIAHSPGSPGRVFILDEDDVAARLARLGELTNGALRWSENAGLKQVQLVGNLHNLEEKALDFLGKDYEVAPQRVA